MKNLEHLTDKELFRAIKELDLPVHPEGSLLRTIIAQHDELKELPFMLALIGVTTVFLKEVVRRYTL